ncbi:glycoside hydrolase family 3 N-terminal domain-containing protein [Porticoccaceae bacterium]|nr:glycoside hydrolase family 3 N-terminal domain-containing protein [Porticoccaceae bacterium]
MTLRIFRCKVTAIAILALIISLSTACKPGGISGLVVDEETTQRELTQRSVTLLKVDDLTFKDLNKNTKLDRYEDWRLSAKDRTEDLLSRMTLEEKAGLMVHANGPGNKPLGAISSSYDLKVVEGYLNQKKITSMITRLVSDPESLARQNNLVQSLAEKTRLGIPFTISTDPRNHFKYTAGASVGASGSFSQWPEALGFAALNDPATTERFADIVRAEYRAIGVHMALSPMADLATEPRWSRINGTFGEDAELAKQMVHSYIKGFQGGVSGLTKDSVATVVKHWVGYGAAWEGFDSHNYYGRNAVFPGDNFSYHIKPFEGAFSAGVSGVMPTYSILKDLVFEGQEMEQVGAGFNKYLLQDLLREQYGFKGVILSDWAIAEDCGLVCKEGGQISYHDVATSWGVEHLSKLERFAKGINAGLDQFGGVDNPEIIVKAVGVGMIPESRIDASARTILLQKFQLGLFDSPFVDAVGAQKAVGQAAIQAEANTVQSQALVILENKNDMLPLDTSVARKVFVSGVDANVVESYGFTVTDDPEEANFAIARLEAPYETLHPGFIFGAMQHEGSLAYKESDEAYQRVKRLAAMVPTIITVFLDRPAVLTPLQHGSAALIGNFGVSDKALMDALVGKVAPKGRLPFELPSSMDAVKSQKEDVPYDSVAPLYPFGFGLKYD